MLAAIDRRLVPLPRGKEARSGGGIETDINGDCVYGRLNPPPSSDRLDGQRLDDQRFVMVDKTEAGFVRGFEALFQRIDVKMAWRNAGFRRGDPGSGGFQCGVRASIADMQSQMNGDLCGLDALFADLAERLFGQGLRCPDDCRNAIGSERQIERCLAHGVDVSKPHAIGGQQA